MPTKPSPKQACSPATRPIVVRVMVWFVVWWMARLPVAVPDFHEVDHHHDSGQTCLYHEHLSRWHSADEQTAPDHQATLHWHWLIPGWTAQEYHDDNPGDATEPGQLPADPPAMIVPEHERFDVLESFIQENARSEKPLVSSPAPADGLKELSRKIHRLTLDFASIGLMTHYGPFQTGILNFSRIELDSQANSFCCRPLRC